MLMSYDKSRKLLGSNGILLVLLSCWLCGLSFPLNAARFTVQEIDFLGSEIDGVDGGSRFDHGTYLVAINHLGHAVGYAEHDGTIRSFLWNNGTAIELQGLGGNYTQVTGINDQGISVGKATLSTGELHACQWDALGNVTDLVVSYPGDWDHFNSHAEGINNLGDITGYYLQSDENGIRFVGFYLAHDASQITSFPSDLLTGGLKNYAINDFSTRAGDKFSELGQVALFQEDEYDEDVLENPSGIFSSGYGRSLNNFSDVTGFCVVEQPTAQQGLTETCNRACVWLESSLRDIAFDQTEGSAFGEDFSQARAINDLNQVVGVARYDADASFYKLSPDIDAKVPILVLDPATTQFVYNLAELPAIPPAWTSDSNWTWAYDDPSYPWFLRVLAQDGIVPWFINPGDVFFDNRGGNYQDIFLSDLPIEARMNRAFLWEKTNDGTYAMQDLNGIDFIGPASAWILSSADGINNAGQIVGHGLINGSIRGFILTPTTPPPPMIRLLKPSNDFLLGDNLQFFAAFNQAFDQFTISSDGSEYNGSGDLTIGNFFHGGIFDINYGKIGEQGITIEFKNSDGEVIESETYTVTIRDLFYEEWRDRKGAGEPGDDTDLDGKKDLIEYAFDLDPTVGEAYIYPSADVDAEGNLLFVYKRRKQAADLQLSYEVQSSNSLASEDWSSYTPEATSGNPNPVTVDPGEEGDPIETVTIRPNDSDFAAGPFFIKVKVSLVE